jgi:CheY-like chemotaxis protein
LKAETMDLNAALSRAIESARPLFEERRQHFEASIPAAPLEINGDLTRITQVLVNLLNNAAKYTPAGGRITLATLRDGDDAVIRVSDTGIGIPADRLPEVFEMFAQVERSSARAQGGLGIGLALVRRLVEMHGGSVVAQSAGPGQGSRFEVRLPTVAPLAALARGDRARDAAAAAGDGSHVLVADDNRDSADSMAMMLDLLGYRTTVVYDGDEALQAASALRPRIAILDIGMPRVNGHEVARRLRSEPWGERMVLIALSGWGRDDDRRKTAAAGFDHHLVKPLDLHELAALLAPVGSGPKAVQ